MKKMTCALILSSALLILSGCCGNAYNGCCATPVTYTTTGCCGSNGWYY